MPATGSATSIDYLSLGGQVIGEISQTGTTTTPTYLHPDLLGSPRKASNAAGEVMWQEHYDPYGAKQSGVTSTKIGYTGHVNDAESGLTYMQARFYDPQVGRFLSTDPIHFSDQDPFTFNRYAYANNNPYKYTDPTGMCPNCVSAVVLGGVGFVAGALVNAAVQAASGNGIDGSDVLMAGLSAGAVGAAVGFNPALAPGAVAALAGGASATASVASDLANDKPVSAGRAVIAGVAGALAAPLGGAATAKALEKGLGKVGSETIGTAVGEATGAGLAAGMTVGANASVTTVNNAVQGVQQAGAAIQQGVGQIKDKIREQPRDNM